MLTMVENNYKIIRNNSKYKNRKLSPCLKLNLKCQVQRTN